MHCAALFNQHPCTMESRVEEAQSHARRPGAAELRSKGLVLWHCRHGMTAVYVACAPPRVACAVPSPLQFWTPTIVRRRRIVDMICAAGESYGYHVMAIMWLMSKYSDLFGVCFDLICKLFPFMLARIDEWSKNETLMKAFGYAGERLHQLRSRTLAFLDEFHGELHNEACRKRHVAFNIPGCPDLRAGNQSESANAYLSRTRMREESELGRAQHALETTSFRNEAIYNDLPRALARDAKHVRALRRPASSELSDRADAHVRAGGEEAHEVVGGDRGARGGCSLVVDAQGRPQGAHHRTVCR